MTPTGPRLELSLPALPTSARRARVAVAAAVAELGIDQRVVDDIRLCVSEAVTNAVRHAYGSDAGTVEITVVDRDPGVVVVVRDFGSGVMGLPRNGAGGFGLAIIDALSDDCALSSVSGAGTEVSMAFGTTLAGRRRQSCRFDAVANKRGREVDLVALAQSALRESGAAGSVSTSRGSADCGEESCGRRCLRCASKLRIRLRISGFNAGLPARFMRNMSRIERLAMPVHRQDLTPA